MIEYFNKTGDGSKSVQYKIIFPLVPNESERKQYYTIGINKSNGKENKLQNKDLEFYTRSGSRGI